MTNHGSLCPHGRYPGAEDHDDGSITDHRPWGCARRPPHVEGLSNSWASTARTHLNDVQMLAHYQPITREMLAETSVISRQIRPLLHGAIRFYASETPSRILAMNEEPLIPVDDVCPCTPGHHVTPCPRA